MSERYHVVTSSGYRIGAGQRRVTEHLVLDSAYCDRVVHREEAVGAPDRPAARRALRIADAVARQFNAWDAE